MFISLNSWCCSFGFFFFVVAVNLSIEHGYWFDEWMRMCHRERINLSIDVNFVIKLLRINWIRWVSHTFSLIHSCTIEWSFCFRSFFFLFSFRFGNLFLLLLFRMKREMNLPWKRSLNASTGNWFNTFVKSWWTSSPNGISTRKMWFGLIFNLKYWFFVWFGVFFFFHDY